MYHEEQFGPLVPVATFKDIEEVFNYLEAVGIDLTDVFLVLENEGVEKFEDSWNDLLKETQTQLDSAAK